MINDVLNLFITAINSCWDWFSSCINSISAVPFVLSIISICVISRFIIFPFFRSTFNSRSDYRRSFKKKDSNDDN